MFLLLLACTPSGKDDTSTETAVDSDTDSGVETGDSDSGEETAPSNEAPQVSFLAPADGSSLRATGPADFVAMVTDDQDALDALTLLWTVDGAAWTRSTAALSGSTATLSLTLPAGDHVVALTAIDGGGLSGMADVSVSMTANALPEASFVAPLDGATFLVGEPVEVDLLVGDPDTADLGDLSLSWSGSAASGAEPAAPDADGHARFYLNPGLGEWSLDVEVTDPDGASVTALVAFDVVSGDGDGDGFVDVALGGDDCDDLDASVNPGAEERCDGVDEDCDGTADDGAADAATWYADADRDGYGDVTATTAACTVPSGYVGDPSDCDDADAGVHPTAAESCDGVDEDCDGAIDDSAVDVSAWYADADHDGYGDGSPTYACSAPSGTAAADGDCNDGDARFHPGADESSCADPNDYNCDGSVAWADDDGDGFAACEECDDTRADVHPGATERCNGLDDDCDGAADGTGSADAVTRYADADGDGHGNPSTATVTCDAGFGVATADDCNDAAAAVYPGATETCDTLDNNCDGAVDEGVTTPFYADLDGDSYAGADAMIAACAAPAGYSATVTDCDDTAADVYPGATETCDGEDDDCDGTPDDGASGSVTWYADGDGDTWGDASRAVSACAAPSGYVATAGDCNDATSTVNPGQAEVCDAANVDEDCDGAADDADVSATGKGTTYADADHDGYGAGSAISSCDPASGSVSTAGDCNDADATVSPAGTETCNGRDDDCDGSTDEGTLSTWWRDSDGDGYGSSSTSTTACSAPSGYVANSSDCNDRRADIAPGQVEYCDGSDNDCDGATDEDAADASTWYRDQDGDAYGDASTSTRSCGTVSGYVGNDDDCDDAVSTVNPAAAEVCDDADNDCDGSIDEGVATTWFRDADGDGYGSTSRTITACTQPSGYASTGTDCNDADSVISPAATERCDASDVDEDCDGLADDADPSASTSGMTTWYVDADGDGHAGATSTTLACDAPAGSSATPDDCDDTDGYTYPGAGERCSDGIDQDCDGVDSTCTYDWSGDYLADDVAVYDAKVYGESSSDYVGFARTLATEGDLDGDGIADLVLGSWGDDTSASSGGAVFVQESPLATGAYDFNTYDTLAIYGTSANAFVGYRLSVLQDWDADGDDELVVGRNTSTNLVYVYEGGLTGAYNYGSGYTTYVTNCYALYDISSLGMFTSGATAEQWACSYYTGSAVERIYIYNAESSATAASIYGESLGDSVGDSLAGGWGRDANGDGIDDLWIGGDGDDDGGAEAGAVWIVEGGTVGSSYTLSSLDGKIRGGSSTAYFGNRVEAADMNGDGYTDTIATAFGATRSGTKDGAVYLFFDTLASGEDSTADAEAVLWGTTGAQVGDELSVGDVNGDGAEDLLWCDLDTVVGGYSSQGAAWLFYGPITAGRDIQAGDYDARWVGASAYDDLGASCSLGGDLDGDGQKDIALGAPYMDHSSSSGVGAIFVMFGG